VKGCSRVTSARHRLQRSYLPFDIVTSNVCLRPPGRTAPFSCACHDTTLLHFYDVVPTLDHDTSRGVWHDGTWKRCLGRLPVLSLANYPMTRIAFQAGHASKGRSARLGPGVRKGFEAEFNPGAGPLSPRRHSLGLWPNRYTSPRPSHSRPDTLHSVPANDQKQHGWSWTQQVPLITRY